MASATAAATATTAARIAPLQMQMPLRAVRSRFVHTMPNVHVQVPLFDGPLLWRHGAILHAFIAERPCELALSFCVDAVVEV